MNSLTLLSVALGGAFGALLRWELARLFARRSFPWATLFSNVIGSALLLIFLARPQEPLALAFFATGFCGALTTFSTWAVDTVRLAQKGQPRLALANVILHMMGVPLFAFLSLALIRS